MKITNSEIGKMIEAIAQLDGKTTLQVTGDKVTPSVRPYKMAATARWLFARAQNTLQKAFADFITTRDALVKAHTDGALEITPEHPNFLKFVADVKEIEKKSVDVPIEQIDPAHLMTQENEDAGNPLPISALAALMPIIKQPA